MPIRHDLARFANRGRRFVVAHDQRLELRPAAAFGGAHGRDGQRDIRPVLAGLLHDLGAAHEFERGLALARAGIEPRIVERRPARAAHRVADAEGRARLRIGCEVDAHLHLARRIGLQRLADPRQLLVDRTLLQLERADRVVGRADFFRDRAERRAPIRDRTRLAFFAEAERRLRGKALGEFLARGLGGDLVFDRCALVFQRLPALLKLRRGRRPLGARGACIDRADRDARRRLAFDAQRCGIEARWKVARDQRGVALREIDSDEPCHGRAVGIDRHGVERGTHIELGRAQRRSENQHTGDGQRRK